MIDDEYIPNFKRIVERWNKVERSLKQAEGLLGYVQQPAINELRYAGRRIIDALAICLQRHGEDVSAHSTADIDRVLLEAEQNCIKADHDVSDAIILGIHQYIGNIVREFGEFDVKTYFPDYFSLKARMIEVHNLVTSSRDVRGERGDIYDDIIENYIPDIVRFYEMMHGAEGSIRLQQKKRLAAEKKQQFIMWGTIAAVFVTMIGVAANILFWILDNAPEK